MRGGSSANNNYGADAELLIKKTSNADFKRMAFLQFDLYDVDMLEKAILRLYAKTANSSNIMDYQTTDNWTEKSLTYSNAPKAGASISSQPVATSGKYYEWDLTNFVISQLSIDDLASFLIADISANKNNIGFNSKEASDNLPQLVITKKSTAIKTATKNPIFSVYPNPAKEFVNVMAENNIEDVSVTNIFGQAVLYKTAIGKKQLKVRVADFAEGMYLFQVRDQNGFKHKLKVLVK